MTRLLVLLLLLLLLLLRQLRPTSCLSLSLLLLLCRGRHRRAHAVGLWSWLARRSDAIMKREAGLLLLTLLDGIPLLLLGCVLLHRLVLGVGLYDG